MAIEFPKLPETTEECLAYMKKITACKKAEHPNCVEVEYNGAVIGKKCLDCGIVRGLD